MLRAFIRSVGSVRKQFKGRFAGARSRRGMVSGVALAAALAIPGAAFRIWGILH